MAKKRQYTEDERALALAAYQSHDSNLDRTAKFLGIPRNTVRRWVNGGAVNEPTVANATSKKVSLADLFEDICYRSLGIAPDKLEGATFAQVMTGAGIAVDKMRLLRGESTQTLEFNDQRAALHEKWSSLTATADATPVSGQSD